jgi:ketosteroid isomerase-like protein
MTDRDRRADAVERYLAALAAHDWSALGACLAPDVERIGPYHDVYRGREAYVGFLADTLRGLAGYELLVSRLIVATDVVVAELSETVDTPAGRRRTDEAVVFDLSPEGLIRHVAVFLRRTASPQGEERS